MQLGSITTIAAVRIFPTLIGIRIHAETTLGAGLTKPWTYIAALQAVVQQDIAIDINIYIAAALGAASYSPHYHNTSTLNGILKSASYVPDSYVSS